MGAFRNGNIWHGIFNTASASGVCLGMSVRGIVQSPWDHQDAMVKPQQSMVVDLQ